MQKRQMSHLGLCILIAMTPVFAQNQQPATPYLANPVPLNRYINKTVPNVAIIVDNSNIMNNIMPTKRRKVTTDPRYIDVVKGALMNLYPTLYQNNNISHNLSLVTLTDAAKDMHWKVDSTQPTGYLFASGVGNHNIFLSSTPNFDPYNVAPVADNGTLQRSIGSGNGKQNYGFNKFKNSTLVGMQTNQQYVPNLSEMLKNTIGYTLLVPFVTDFTQNSIIENHQNNLDLLTRTISLSDGKMKDVLPNTIDYLEENIQYRCQESYALIITNDLNEITDEANVAAVRKYAKVHPKLSSNRDAEGYLYNQKDFPNQYIKTFLLALSPSTDDQFVGNAALKVLAFGEEGAGQGALAVYAKDVASHLKDFIHKMNTGSLFVGSSPAVYVSKDPISGALVQRWISSTSDPNGWSGHIGMKNTFESTIHESMRYVQDYPSIFLNTGKDIVRIAKDYRSTGFIKDQSTLTHADFGLNTNENLNNFIAWMTGNHPIDKPSDASELGDDLLPEYRYRSANTLSETRYLGDITSDVIEVAGTFSSAIKAPNVLLAGSNDGMLKMYVANPLYNMAEDSPIKDLEEPFPYVYTFAYIPGGAKREDGSTLMESFKYRADYAYGTESKTPVHEYGISGQIAYRTTNKGHTFMVGTLGQGGFGAFSLNVGGHAHDDPSLAIGMDTRGKAKQGENTLSWDTNSTAFGNASKGSEALGYIMGRAVIARVAESRTETIPDLYKNVRYVAVLPSGEFGDQSIDSGPTLYIYDALGIDVALRKDKKDSIPGTLIQKVTAKIPKGTKLKYKNSLSAATLVDLNFDGVADIGYVGDLNGNLYRLDLRGDKPSNWTLEMIYEGDANHPITHAPSVSRYDETNVVIFGTGSYNKKDDFNGNIYQQDIYGIFENDTFTAHQDEPLNKNSAFLDQVLGSDLEKLTRSISDNEIEQDYHVGWRIPLSYGTAREALSQKPVIFNGTVFFQTYVLHEKKAMPDNAICYRPDLSPDTWLFQINARTGGVLNDEHDTRLVEMGDEHVVQFDDTILPTLKLVTSDVSSSVSKDGEMQNGNDPDFELRPEKSTSNSYTLRKANYLNPEGECNAIVTNGMELYCPPYEENLKPGRLSIMKRNAY